MSAKVLVLNADFRVLYVCSVQKAIVLLFLDKAEMVDRVEHSFLRTVSQSFALPSIIRLHRYVNMPFKGVMLNRNNIFKRDGHMCVYCGAHRDLTLDHVIPKSKGGRGSWTNLVTACKSCNSKKGDRTPLEAGLVLRKKPFKPSFVSFLRETQTPLYNNWSMYINNS